MYQKHGVFTDNQAPGWSAALANDMDQALEDSGRGALSGPGIDLTGATICTTGVQAFLNAVPAGTRVYIPNGGILNLDAKITISRRIDFDGAGGEFRFTAGVVGDAALNITADGTTVRNLRVVNYAQTANQTGDKQYGIFIAANGVKILGCTTRYFQQAIAVSPFGEFHDYIINDNHILDVIGSGTGAGGDSPPNPPGEDRGDGIVSWGAAGTIVGNRVTAMAGTDARIGIHTEGLASLETNGYAHSSALVSISGNVITGRFRRGIVSESVRYVSITGNAVADATWWGIALVDASHCTVTGNTVKWTRTPSDNQGSSWGPRRAGIMAYGGCNGSVIGSNSISVETTAYLPYGIAVQTAPNPPAPAAPSLSCDDLLIIGNQINDDGQVMSAGFYFVGAGQGINRVRVLDNLARGFTEQGLNLYGCSDLEVRGNRLEGKYGTNAAIGVQADTSSTGARVNDNWISWTAVAIHLYGRNALTQVNGNMIYNATTGLDLQGTAGASANDNLFNVVPTHAINMPAGAITIGNN